MFNKLGQYFKFSLQSVGALLVVLYLIFSPAFIFSSLNKTDNLINRQIKVDYYGVLELWNIDTFEGGSSSRTSWLEARGIEFEKAHRGTFVIVRNMTLDQAISNLEGGSKPSLISYGAGLGHILAPYLANFSGTTNVRDDLKEGGVLNGNLLAVPYILGGYALVGSEKLLENDSSSGASEILDKVFSFTITQNKKTTPSLIFGANMYINPALALVLNTNQVASKNDISSNIKELDSYSAYEQYVLFGKASLLLGTQRDVYRCKNREESGKLSPQNYYFLEGFSDLVQYISIFKSDAKTLDMCTKFIEHLTSPATQKTLSQINMFSTLDLQIYYDNFYKEWEKVLQNKLNTPNIFLHSENIKEQIDTAILALSGDNLAKEKINNMF